MTAEAVILVDACVTVADVDARAEGRELPRHVSVLSDLCLCVQLPLQVIVPNVMVPYFYYRV